VVTNFCWLTEYLITHLYVAANNNRSSVSKKHLLHKHHLTLSNLPCLLSSTLISQISSRRLTTNITYTPISRRLMTTKLTAPFTILKYNAKTLNNVLQLIQYGTLCWFFSTVVKLLLRKILFCSAYKICLLVLFMRHVIEWIFFIKCVYFCTCNFYLVSYIDRNGNPANTNQELIFVSNVLTYIITYTSAAVSVNDVYDSVRVEATLHQSTWYWVPMFVYFCVLLSYLCQKQKWIHKISHTV